MGYKLLADRFKKIDSIEHLMSVAHWDEATMMPDGGAESRGQAMAQVGVLAHELITDPNVGEWIEKAKAENLSEWESSNLREIESQWRHKTSIPSDLVEATAVARAKCGHAWRSLRPANDWEGFLPLFEPLISLVRQQAQALGDGLGCDPYDALIDQFEPGQTQSSIAATFAQLKEQLPVIIEAAVEKSGRVSLPKGPFPKELQKQLGEVAMRHLGFDFNHGRLDVSHHPFCGGVPKDVRITTRYDEENFIESLMGVIHETGHARYEQNLPDEWLDQPVGKARGMGVHEGQSLLFENMVGHSPEFLSFLAPKMADTFGSSSEFDWSAGSLTPIVNRVEKSFIRTSADEVTYPMHVILRFELEQQIISGSLEVRDIPEAWDSKMQAYLGLSTKGDFRNGCMQDVHWPEGAFGYFPSYTLGAMTAAQLYEKALLDHPGIPEKLSQGDTSLLNTWLRENVWSKGSFYTVDELMTVATGAKLSSRPFIDHLKSRYL